MNNTLNSIIKIDYARKSKLVPIDISGNKLIVGISQSTDDRFKIKEELELLSGMQVEFEELTPDQIFEKTELLYGKIDNNDERLKSSYYDGNPENFLNDLIREAQSLKSSDIHIEVYEELCRVRIRIDGQLIQRYLIEKKNYPSIVNKIKIISNLDIAEKRLPQDGRIFFQTSDKKFDIRVSVVPTLYGEKIVLRLLTSDFGNIDLSSLGFSENDLSNYLEGIKKPHGILLISGPTGSGKTTTLYATLKLLNKSTKNILTIEDPIEYTLAGVNQVQVKENIGLTFASALRHFLRQDPDIIMLGEIRDQETATMAIRAALTGHLVLSTIHTNSAWDTVSRLTDQGIPPFLLASTLNLTVAQRLVRLLCENCKQKETFDSRLFPKRFKPKNDIKYHYIAKGCPECYNTGYRTRKAIYEVIPIDDILSDEIKKCSTQVNHLLTERAIKTLSQNAFDLFESGYTSLDEIYPLLTN